MSEQPLLLFTPGPVMVSPEVLKRLAEPPLHHRSKEFQSILSKVHSNLQTVFCTTNPVLLLTCSGTGACEAAISSVGLKGKAVVLSNGRFSERLGKICETHGIDAVYYRVEWGKSFDPDDVKRFLRKHSDAATVWFAHSETSTGALNDAKSIARVIQQESSALVCMDAITSIAINEVLTDEWGLDIVVAASQKGLGTPPGLSCLSLSKRAQEATMTVKQSSYYFNLKRTLAEWHTGKTPWTPAVSLTAALDLSLTMLLQTGLTATWLHHQNMGDIIRQCAENLGLINVADAPSNAVTALFVPSEHADVQQNLQHNWNIIVANGQGVFKNKIFRIGHIGSECLKELNVKRLLDAMRKELSP